MGGSHAASVFSRARYAEDNLIKAVGQGVRQYVILGAAYSGAGC